MWNWLTGDGQAMRESKWRLVQRPNGRYACQLQSAYGHWQDVEEYASRESAERDFEVFIKPYDEPPVTVLREATKRDRF